MQALLPTDPVQALAVIGFGGVVALTAARWVAKKAVSTGKAAIASARSPRTTTGRKKQAAHVADREPLEDDELLGGGSFLDRLELSTVLRLSKLAIFPLLGTAAFVYVARKPEVVHQFVPALFSAASYASAAIPTVPIPSLKTAFELGNYWRDVNGSLIGTDEELAGISAFAKLIGRTDMTRADVIQYPELLRDAIALTNQPSRFQQIFTVVNAVWLASICGLTVFIGPLFFETLVVPFKSFWEKLLGLGELVSQPLFFAIAFYIACESTRYPVDGDSMVGTFLALTGIAGYVLSWFWSVFLNSSNSGDEETFFAITGALVAIVSGPLAVFHQSTMLGYLTVASLLGSLYNSSASDLLRIFGYDRWNQCASFVSATQFLTLGYASALVMGKNPEWLAPIFGPAIGRLGSTAYFGALFLLTFDYRHLVGTPMFLANLALYVYLGEGYQLDGFTAVAKAFGTLFVCSKVIEGLFRAGNPLLAGFLSCGGLSSSRGSSATIQKSLEDSLLRSDRKRIN